MPVVKRKYFLAVFFALFSVYGITQPAVSVTQNNYFPRIFSIPLQPVKEVPVSDAVPDLYVYVFVSPECPLCRHYIPELKKLQADYPGKILVKGIIPGRSYSQDTLVYFSNEYQINFPLFIDSSKFLSKYLSASVTPEVMVFTKQRERIYQGAVDNWMKELGVKRVKPTKFYLRDAITAALNNRTISIPKTRATGCLINDF